MRGLALVVLCGCGRVAFDARVDAGADTGDGAVASACNGIDLLADTFPGTSLDMKIWTSSYANPGTSFAVAGGDLVLTPAANAAAQYTGAVSYRFFDLRGERVFVDIQEVGTNGASTGIQLEATGHEYVTMFAANGVLLAAHASPRTQFTEVARTPYDPIQHRFMALSEAGGVLSYETSPDGVSFTAMAQEPAPIDLRLVRQHIYTGTDTSVAVPGRGRASSVAASPQPPSPRCSTEQIVDTFENDPLLNLWANSFAQACCTVAASSGRIVLASNGTAGYSGAHTSAAYDLRGHEIHAELVSAPASMTAQLVVTRDYDNRIGLAVYGSSFDVFEIVNGVTTDHTGSWSPSERFLRLREDAGQYSAEVSGDGTTWRLAYSGPAPFALDDVVLDLEAGSLTGGFPPDTAAWDNFNVPL